MNPATYFGKFQSPKTQNRRGCLGVACKVSARSRALAYPCSIAAFGVMALSPIEVPP